MEITKNKIMIYYINITFNNAMKTRIIGNCRIYFNSKEIVQTKTFRPYPMSTEMIQKFLQQKLFHTLRIGITTSVEYQNHVGSIHCRQSDLDKACGLHCAAMAFTLLGLITSPRICTKQEKGIAARLWQASKESYFHGLENQELASLLKSLKTELQIDNYEGSHRKTLAFTTDQLLKGGVAIISWRTKDRQTHHWVLVVGVEGMQIGKSFTITTLLVLDPGNEEPRLCGYNGRIQLNSHPIRGTSLFVEYVTVDGTTTPITLTSAVSIKK